MHLLAKCMLLATTVEQHHDPLHSLIISSLLFLLTEFVSQHLVWICPQLSFCDFQKLYAPSTCPSVCFYLFIFLFLNHFNNMKPLRYSSWLWLLQIPLTWLWTELSGNTLRRCPYFDIVSATYFSFCSFGALEIFHFVCLTHPPLQSTC